MCDLDYLWTAPSHHCSVRCDTSLILIWSSSGAALIWVIHRVIVELSCYSLVCSPEFGGKTSGISSEGSGPWFDKDGLIPALISSLNTTQAGLRLVGSIFCGRLDPRPHFLLLYITVCVVKTSPVGSLETFRCMEWFWGFVFKRNVELVSLTCGLQPYW